MLTPQNFVIWLQGFLEACGNELDEKQTQKVREKLDSIFSHEAEKVEDKLDLHYPEFGHNHTLPGEEGVVRC